MQFSILLSVAAGGALGALGRFATTSAIGHLMGPGFPYGTITVNVLGSFVMGVLAEAAALVWSPTPEVRALLMVGFLGAFTTFSTFSLDVYVLAQRGELALAWLYVLLSVTFSVGALFLGLHAARAVLS
ncbi:MAG: fluoride efflux transporter CrcB [Magnetospiraceae bacterium]